jgi:hypothetical protein
MALSWVSTWGKWPITPLFASWSALQKSSMTGPHDCQQKTTKLFHVRHLERPPLETPYPDIVTRMGALVRSAPLVHARTALVVDATGVVRPVVDLFRQAKLNPRPITITGGALNNTLMGASASLRDHKTITYRIGIVRGAGRAAC